MAEERKTETVRRPKLDLPFVKRKPNVAEWVYGNRVAIFATLAAYLLFAAAFLTVKIVISKKATNSEIVVDFADLEKLEAELQRAQELNRILNEQYDESAPVRNEASNENALDDRLADHRTDASQIYDEADRVQERIRGNAADYEAGLQAEREILDRRYEGEHNDDRRIEGNVTVSYSLTDPIRSAQILPRPSYMCRGGGDITVNILVNRNGEVVDAVVDRSRSTDNDCMRQAAVAKALASQFNADASAPQRQRGTINYKFVPQR